MKVVMRVLLALGIVLLAYISWRSIQGPIDFNAEVARRDQAVIQRLVDIRTAQIAFRAQTVPIRPVSIHSSVLSKRKIATLVKSGDLSEAQLEDGMTEEKAMKIIRTGDEKAIKAAGLWDESKNAPQLVRDSIFTPAVEVLYPNRTSFNIDDLRYVPFANGAQFEMGVGSLVTASGYPIQVFEAKVPYSVYLADLDQKLLNQKIQEVLDRPGNKYPGMQVGSLEVANNNAGNWE